MKAQLNYDAARLLIDKNLYAPSIHCSYYSCLQLLKFTISDFFDVSYEQIESDIVLSGKKTHQYMIDFIYTELSAARNMEESRNFKRKIKELKKYREDSDYADVEINIDKGNLALIYAYEIRGFLQKKFHV